MEYPKISRARIKAVNAESQIIGDGTTSDPTEEEREWIAVLKSDAPELEVRKKKLSVCATADVVDYNADAVKIQYDGRIYTVKKPTNSLQIARAYERGRTAAFEALAAQLCVCDGAIPVRDLSAIPVEVIRLLSAVADDFFFMPYLS